MAYHIQYGKPGKIERFERLQKSSRYKIAKYVIIGMAILSLALLRRAGKLDFLIPGDKQITRDAFQTMVEDVKSGENIKSVVTAFCEEILTSDQN
jgi:hypothetical protein